MSENMIGIKQADGSFYPIMKEGEPAVKELELTTVRDDQTTIQLNLYKSATGTMKDAVYVDTLLIENLNPHPQGEPSINLQLNLDDEGNLSAQIDDPETGGHSDHTVSLITLDSAALNSEPDYNLPDDSDYGSPSDFADLPPMDSDFDLADVFDGADGFDLPEDDDFSIGTDTAGETPLAEEDSDFSLDDILSDIGELPPLDDMDFDIGPDVTESVGADGEDFAVEAADGAFESAPVTEEARAGDTDALDLGDFDLPDLGNADETSLTDFDIGGEVSEPAAASDSADFAVTDAANAFDGTDFAVSDADGAFEAAPAADTDFAVNDTDSVIAAAPVSEEAPAEDTDMLGLGDFDLPDMASVDETSLSDFDTGSDASESVAADDTDFAVNDTDSVIAAAPVSEEAPAEDTDMLGLGDFDLPDMASVDETSLSDFDTGSDVSESVAADDTDFAVNGTGGGFEAAPADDTDFAVNDADEAFEAGPAADTDFAVTDTDGVFEAAPADDDTDFAVGDTDSVFAAAPVSEEAPAEDTDMLGLGDFDLPDMDSVDETSLSDFDIGSDASESVAAADTDFAVSDADGVFEAAPADDTDFAVNGTDRAFEAAPADDTDFAVTGAEDAFDTGFAVSDAGNAFEAAPADDADFAVDDADSVIAAAPVSEEA
ncbi:MAG: hypothetical protein MJ183_01150, partial [Treponemataceae bacterium]|nr:hypothetical protein [Treponemataceae bacterium]